MYKLCNRLGVPTVRVQAMRGEPAKRVQAILDLKQSDVQGHWGVRQVRQRLANKDILVTWCIACYNLTLHPPLLRVSAMNFRRSYTTTSTRSSIITSQENFGERFLESLWTA